MSEAASTHDLDLARLSSEIVAAYVSRNAIPAESLPALMDGVHKAIVALQTPLSPVTEQRPAMPSPAEIRRSVKADGITSFLDGRSYQTLKRHIGTHGFTPDTYRARFGLPQDYPMTAAAYTARRSQAARTMGLGRPRRDAASPSALLEPTSPATDPTPKPMRTGRSKAKQPREGAK